MRFFLPFTLLLLMMSSCGSEGNEIPDAVKKIPVEVRISRFDRDFATATPEALESLKSDYPYLFPIQYPDSLWVAKMKDTLQQELLHQIDSVFPSFSKEEAELELLFKHVKYYFPDFSEPKVITLPSEVDYRNRVILADSLLLIGLDNYLGEDHHFYKGIDRYIAEGLDKKFLISDVAEAYAEKVVPRPRDRSFLARMIYYGKLLFVKQKLLPLESDEIVMGYTEEDMSWARSNEEQMWRYFIERELLYSTDAELAPRFLNPAPFSKFRLELDNESPGRLGQFIGWQIVRSYMNNNDIKMTRMLNMPAEDLFRASGYKPNK